MSYCRGRWHTICSFCMWTLSVTDSKACETVCIISDQVKVSVCRQVPCKGRGWF